MKIKDGIYYVGIREKRKKNIDGLYEAKDGITYNSYLITGDGKSALIDLVPEDYHEEFLKNIENIMPLEKIDYIILSTTELSHSGALPKIMEKTSAKVVISKHGFMMLKEIMHRNIDPILVQDKGEKISLGNKTLELIYSPYVFWPDTLFIHIPEDNIIFTGNFLSSAIYHEKIFDDEIEDFQSEFITYYKKFLRPFNDYVLEAIEKLEKKKIDMIAPGFGPVIRKNVKKYIEIYKDLSTKIKGTKKKALIFFATSYGGTYKIAEKIAEGLEENNVETELIDLMNTRIDDKMLDRIEESDALIVGSNTVNADAMKEVWYLLSSLGTINLRNKVGFAFGTYAWSGESARLIESRLRDLRLKVPEEHFRAMLIPTEDDLYNAKEIGKRLADILNYRVI
ncbi:MAG: FprA family A-type flavoprotein [Thermoplasmata archaeon]